MFSTSNLLLFEGGMAEKPVDFGSLSSATEAGNASIHGVVAAVSPMKRGGKTEYFEAKITDGEGQMRVVGFSGSQRKRMASFEEKVESVVIENCQVKKSRRLEDLEILLRSSSRLESSPKKFKSEDIVEMRSMEITLGDLDSRSSFEKVSLVAKVLRVCDPVKVSGGLSKQDIIIADSSDCGKLTVWEKDVGCVTEGSSYRFSNVVIRSYQLQKFLSLPKDGASIVPVEDIGDVANDDVAEQYTTINSAEVVGVMSLASYAACLQCKAKVEPTKPNLGCCTKCGMQQIVSRCKTQLNVKVILSSGDSYVTLNVFGTDVGDIAGLAMEDVTEESLLSAPAFNVTYENNVVTSISRT